MHALSVRVEQAGNIFDGRYGCSKRVVPRIIIDNYSSRNAEDCVPGFFCAQEEARGQT